MTKIKTMNLVISKIQMKECGDWFSPELANIEPGLYLCELPDGGMFLMSKRNDGGVDGMFLPIQEIGKIYAEEAEQKVFEQIKPILEKGFGDIESKLKPIATATNNSDCILNEMDESLHVKLANIEEYLGDLKNRIAELPKHSEQQKSTLAEMSDAVVNIIKATKK
jgi:hypothetical protein